MNKILQKKVKAAFFGTIVEYYDYSLYGFSAAILASKFFPNKEEISALMAIFTIYAVSYIAKPFGSVFFSRIGDYYGRKLILKITILGIAIPTLIIGLLPGYETIGSISASILILCRFFQGFFAAAEYDGAAIYVIEHLGRKYHYTASAITRATGVLGLLLGIAVTNFFNSSIFPEWCWRIPFLLSLPLAILTIYQRRHLIETPEFLKIQQNKESFTQIIPFFKKRYKKLLLVIFLAGGFGVTYQVSIIFMKQYLPMIIPETKKIISSFSALLVFIFGLSMPIAGWFADKYGTKLVLIASISGTFFGCIMFYCAVTFNLMNLALISTLIISASVAPFNALAHGIIANIFPANERYRGISIGHNIGSMLMSGTAGVVCLFFMREFNIMLFPIYYISIFSVLFLIIVKLMDSK